MLSFIFNLPIYRTSIFVFDDLSAVLDITVILPDILKDVIGHDVPEGVEEDLLEDEEAGADERDTGQPEIIGAPGEIGVVEIPEKLDIHVLTIIRLASTVGLFGCCLQGSSRSRVGCLGITLKAIRSQSKYPKRSQFCVECPARIGYFRSDVNGMLK